MYFVKRFVEIVIFRTMAFRWSGSGKSRPNIVVIWLAQFIMTQIGKEMMKN